MKNLRKREGKPSDERNGAKSGIFERTERRSLDFPLAECFSWYRKFFRSVLCASDALSYSFDLVDSRRESDTGVLLDRVRSTKKNRKKRKNHLNSILLIEFLSPILFVCLSKKLEKSENMVVIRWIKDTNYTNIKWKEHGIDNDGTTVSNQQSKKTATNQETRVIEHILIDYPWW